MTLEVEMSARLDASGPMASLTGELSGSITDLQSIDLALTVETSDGAATAATEIDLGPLTDTVNTVLSDLTGVLDGLPVAGDLIGPIQTGIETLDGVFAANLETDVTAALDRIGAEFDAIQDDNILNSLRQLAASLGGASELSAVQTALTDLIQLVSGAPGSADTGIGDVFAAILSTLDAIGAMMTLDTMLAEARRLGLLVEAQLPQGRVADLTGACEAAVAQVEATLDGLDVTSDAAVDLAIDAMVAARAQAAALIETLNDSMAFGEATLTYADPLALVARTESILERLRGIAMDELQAAATRLSGLLAPLVTVDMDGIPQFSLAGLLGDVEVRAATLAGEITAFDLSGLSAPLSDGLGSIAGLVDDLRATLDGVEVTLTDALGGVRDAVAAVPIEQVVDALRLVTDVIADALATLGDLLGGAEAAIGDAAGLATTALARAETAVTDFRTALDTLFGEARDFVDGLGLDAAVGQVSDEIQKVADVIGQADMTPYFGTAQDAIDTTADVIDKVPFSLLPDEMEQEVVDLVRPIKTADAQAFRADIMEVLQINEDGTFALRDDLESAVSEVQAQFDTLVAAMAALDPQLLADEINTALDDLRGQIETVVPSVELAPLTEALDAAKAVVGDLDLTAVLQPLNDGFDTVLAQIDDFAPSALLAPLDAEVDALRQKILDATHLSEWQEKLDDARTQALDLAALIDPTALETPLIEAFTEVRTLLAAGNLPDPLRPFGAIVSLLLEGGGEVVMPDAINRVSVWLRGQSVGGTQLQALTTGLRDSITIARQEVEAADPNALAARISADTTRITAAINALPAGPSRDRLLSVAQGLDISADLRLMGPNHARFAAFLAQSETQAANLAAKGFGEVDTVSAVIRTSLAPLLSLLDTPKKALSAMGFTNLDDGLAGILGQLLDEASPDRLVAIVLPIFQAFHGRVEALLDAIIQPLRDIIDDLLGIVNLFDLTALSTALDTIHAEVRADIAAFHPDALLGDVIGAFSDAQAAVAGFDPLGPVIDTLDTLKETVARVLDLLDGDALLALPIEVFADIMALLDALNLNDLLGPLYDRLDAIAGQVSSGLEGTVSSFEGLQEALPSQVGSTSVGVSASVSVGGG